MSMLLIWQQRRIAEYTDAATVYLDLQVVSTETADYTDAATVYLDLQVITFVAPTMDLEIIIVKRRFVLTTRQRFILTYAPRWIITTSKRFYLEVVRRFDVGSP